MTQSEMMKLDKRYLSEKAQTFFEQSDQSVWEFFEDVDKDDTDKISEIAEDLFDEIFKDDDNDVYMSEIGKGLHV